MSIEITMPRLSDTMEQGTVVKWNVKEGDTVSSGDVIADIETDKATMELEAFDTGTVAKLVAAEGEQVAVGSVIVVLAEEGEDAGEVASSAGASAGASGGSSAPAKKEQQAGGSAASSGSGGSTAVAEPPKQSSPTTQTNGAAPSADSGPASGKGGRIFASPLARKIAEERGIDLSAVSGSGPSGRIVKKDVESFTGRSVAAPTKSDVMDPAPLEPVSTQLESRSVPLNNMRATIARRLVESKTTVPHYQVTVSARLDALMELRTQLNEQLESQGVKLSVNDFLVRACARAMHQHPYVNSSWNAQGAGGGPSIDLHAQVNVGVAVALPEERGGGLVVATIRDADRHGLRHISTETKRLAKKARDKGLSIEEMSDSTFTISNLGMFGVDHFTAIINPPNAAILAVGAAVEKPFIERDEDGEPVLVVGHEMSMTMSSDHRIIDGAMAAQYLGTVKQLLEHPATLLV